MRSAVISPPVTVGVPFASDTVTPLNVTGAAGVRPTNGASPGARRSSGWTVASVKPPAPSGVASTRSVPAASRRTT